MVKQLNDFPPHVLSAILGDIVTPAEGCQPQIDTLTISTAFYLAAITHVYNDANVPSSGITSFFLHNPIDPNIDVHNLHNIELVKAGHTKLAAFRHVRKLHVDFPRVSREDYVNKINNKLSKNEEEGIVRKAEEVMQGLPVDFMPNAKSIQIGKAGKRSDGRGMLQQAENFTEELFGRTTPHEWCQYNPQRLQPFEIITDDQGNPQLPTLHRHLCRNDPFSIILGSTNYLYIHCDTPVEHPYHRGCGTHAASAEYHEEQAEQGVGSWLAKEIKECIQDNHGTDQAIVAKTRIIIGGASKSASHRVAEAKLGLMRYYQSSGKAVEELSGAQDVLQTVKKVLGEAKCLGGIQIEAVMAADVPACPVCNGRVPSVVIVKRSQPRRGWR